MKVELTARKECHAVSDPEKNECSFHSLFIDKKGLVDGRTLRALISYFLIHKADSVKRYF